MPRFDFMLAVGSVALIASGCSVSLGSPVEVTNRPLAEQIADRNEAAETASESIPGALAFAQQWPAGAFLRLDVAESGSEVALRSGPSSTFDQISDVPPGSEVIATGNQTGEWVHVLYAAFDGWIHVDNIVLGSVIDETVDLASLDEETILYQVIGDIGVNIRSAPSVNGELVGGASGGAEVLGTGEVSGSWIEIEHDGVTGWASGRWLRPLNDVSTAPATTAAPRRQSPATTAAPSTTQEPTDPESTTQTGGGQEPVAPVPDATTAPTSVEPAPATASSTTTAPVSTAEAPATTVAPAPTADVGSQTTTVSDG